MTGALECWAHVAAVLAAYTALPETPDRPRPPDRAFAGLLHDRPVPLTTVHDALLLATARRLVLPERDPKLSPIRSLYYFSPVIEELLQTPLPAGYAGYLRRKIAAWKRSGNGSHQ